MRVGQISTTAEENARVLLGQERNYTRGTCVNHDGDPARLSRSRVEYSLPFFFRSRGKKLRVIDKSRKGFSGFFLCDVIAPGLLSAGI